MTRTTTQRGYGYKHRQASEAARARLTPGQPCARCGRPMWPGQKLELDHTDDRRSYRGLAHKLCNARAGGRKGGKISARMRAARRVLAREW